MLNRLLCHRVYKYLQLYCFLTLYLVTTVTTGLAVLLSSEDEKFPFKVSFCNDFRQMY